MVTRFGIAYLDKQKLIWTSCQSRMISAISSSPMKTKSQFLTVVCAVFCVQLMAAISHAVSPWQRWETSLTSSKTYTNPYADVTVSVKYTGPSGQVLNAYGFWDGGSTYKIRCAFPATGTWTWATTCSDTTNGGLHNKTGSVSVTSYSGANPLYQRGFLKVSSNKRYLTYSDNTPFLWVGDTIWDGAWKGSLTEWQAYVDNRATKKFSVVQVHATKTKVTGTTANRNGHAPFDSAGKPTPGYWQDLDAKLQYANEKGIAVLLVGLGDPQEPTYTSLMATQTFARYIAGRVYGNHVILSPSMDLGFDSDNDAMGGYLNSATSVHLITQHVNTSLSAAETYHEKSYLDFNAFQSGHAGGSNGSAYGNGRTFALTLYGKSTVKPVVNSEAMYDGRGSDSGTNWREQDARKIGWMTMLSGSFGYTYGAGETDNHVSGGDGGIWKFNTDSADYDFWQTVMGWRSGTQMTYLRDFFGAIEWWQLAPAHSLIKNQTTNNTTMMTLAKNSAGTLGVAYLPDNSSIQIDMGGFSSAMTAKWFNPTNNTYTAISGTFTNSGTQTFTRPSTGDWALLLQATSGGGGGGETGTGPVGHWKLDETSGTSASDSSGNNITGTLTNGPVWATGKIGNALQFDGSNDYVALGTPAALQITGAMTLSAWVYIDTFTTNGRIIAKQGGSSARCWSLNVESNGVAAFQIASNSSTLVIVSSAISSGQWVHLTGVYEPGSALRLYINGALAASNTTSIPSTQFNNSLAVNIGRRPDASNYFDGTIDDVRVYNRSLTATEVSALYGGTTGGGGGGSGETTFTVSDTTNAADWSAQTNLQAADRQYGDRTYTFTTVPTLVAGADWIRTANDSKAYTSSPLVTLSLGANTDVYVAHNDAISTKPSWLTGWTNTGEKLVNNESTPGSYTLFKKSFTAGSNVELGSNGHTTAGMYTIILKATP
jgi:hypothetical protein